MLGSGVKVYHMTCATVTPFVGHGHTSISGILACLNSLKGSCPSPSPSRVLPLNSWEAWTPAKCKNNLFVSQAQIFKRKERRKGCWTTRPPSRYGQVAILRWLAEYLQGFGTPAQAHASKVPSKSLVSWCSLKATPNGFNCFLNPATSDVHALAVVAAAVGHDEFGGHGAKRNYTDLCANLTALLLPRMQRLPEITVHHEKLAIKLHRVNSLPLLHPLTSLTLLSGEGRNCGTCHPPAASALHAHRIRRAQVGQVVDRNLQGWLNSP